jgi:mycothiol system anti-sigma-R factor
MSCGDHHDVDCGVILAALDAYLDGEESPLDRAMISAHLHECGPCLREEQVERLVKAKVARACGSDACSDRVRTRIITRIREIRVDASATGVVTTQATYTSVRDAD